MPTTTRMEKTSDPDGIAGRMAVTIAYGKILNIETGKPFSYGDACVVRGATAG